jgi:pimeloyl-ACP methyl ester carboxylesterase
MSAKTEEIRPFTIKTNEADLEELRRRVAATRWPEKEPVNDQSQGVSLKTAQQIASYWLSDYDWHKCETKLNALPQFMTEIDGLDIHFLHIRSKHDNAMPLLVSHGWPGSILEQLKLIGPLTDPTAYGGSASDAFDLVIPSMPGYGYSGKPMETGWGPDHVGHAWVELMKRLGYSQFVAQGGDWGAIVVDLMGVSQPPELLGIHTNMAGTVPPELDNLFQKNLIGAANALENLPPGLSDEERQACEQLDFAWKHVFGQLEMASRPQTLTGLTDSPVFLATYVLDHDPASLAMISRSFDGVPEGITRDDFLDNVTHFWLTNSGVSAGRIYADNKFSFWGVKGNPIPVAVSAFPDEMYVAPKSWAERAYPKLMHYNKVAKGGHFAAWEQPQILSEEVRASFKPLR